jgi:hypothetical protein
MDTHKVVPNMKGGVVVKIKQNSRGTYDGIIETSNKNKYYFFNNDKFLNTELRYNFDVTTSDIDNCDDFVAINIVPF